MRTSLGKRLSNVWLPWRLAIRTGTFDFLVDRGRRRRFLAVLFQHAIDEVVRHAVPAVEIQDLAPLSDEIALTRLDRREGTMSVFEICRLVAIARKAPPRRIFEIGTFTGNTTLQLAANTPRDSEIVTRVVRS